ncbi:glutamyl-tRNA amidotransferase subunit A [Hypoxylon argillaceum]|nr:glutamyl-tRNA amidotransferase subunit A [Hypoxylon argillaceum]
MRSPNYKAGIPSLLDITIDDIVLGLDQKLFSCADLVEAYITRTSEVNDDLRPVLQINPDALLIAKSLDAELQSGHRRGPLHGVPILLKDNIGTHDQLDGSAGSLALSGAKAPRESLAVQKLRAAGAVILGKSNMSEWANMRSSNVSDGWSPRGGQTKGIYCVDQNPKGSSTGSAVAAALGLSLGALGSETDGSLVCPAEKNNVVAIKPTVGLVSRDGVIPLSLRQDTLGPMTRTVKDAAYLLSTIAGPDAHDKFTDKIPSGSIPDYTSSCTTTSLAGLRVGIPRNAFQVSSVVEDTFTMSLKRLQEAGATVIDNTDYVDLDGYINLDPWLQDVVIMTDFKESLNRYLQDLVENPNNIENLEQLITYTKSSPGEEFPKFDTAEFETAQTTNGTSDPSYIKALALEAHHFGEGGILGALEKWNLDALLVPTCAKLALRLAAIGGLPIVSLPLGFYPDGTDIKWNARKNMINIGPNIPFCLTIFGKPFSEATLIRIAYAHEQLNKDKQKRYPVKLPTTELVDIVKRRSESASSL